MPLVASGRLIGVIDLESTEPDAFTEEHEQMLLALASHAATALEVSAGLGLGRFQILCVTDPISPRWDHSGHLTETTTTVVWQ